MIQYNSIPATQENHERSVILTDLLAAIILQWKKILICFLTFLILGLGISFLFAKTTEPLSVRLTNARDALDKERAADVENLRVRYLAYQDYQRSIQDDYAHYLSNASRASEYVIIRATYYIYSSLENLDVILPYFVLNDEDDELLRTVTSEDGDFTNVYQRVQISCGRGLTGAHDGSTYVYILSENETPAPISYYVWVTLYGNSEEECDAILEIVDNALKRSVESFRSMDSEISLEPIQSEYTHNVLEFLNTKINNTRNILNDIENQMSSLSTRISRLSAEEKAYYDLLTEETTEDSEISQKHVSWKKWALLGAVFGLIAGVGLCILQYMFDGKLKTVDETETIFHTHTLQHLYLPGEKNLFGKLAMRLIEADACAPEVKTDLCAADIYLRLRKNDHKCLYLSCDAEDTNALYIAECLKKRIYERDKDIIVSIGNPSASVDELEAITQADEVAIITELKHSRISILTQWAEICRRFEQPVAGSIAVEVCW